MKRWPGNCLIGALWLLWRHRRESPRLRMLPDWPPHFVVDTTGGSWHFRWSRDIVRGPLFFLLFFGRFARLRKHSPWNVE